ncbi:MAG: hypothetical protein Fur0011_6130 [Candidatus Microgenomates bacterium]
MIKNLTRITTIFVLLFATIFVTWPLVQPGWFDVHDPTAVARLSMLKSTLEEGQIPAAWNNSLNNGFGYPIFLYYAPLFTYFSALISLATPTLLIAIKITLFFCVALSLLGMYTLTKKYGRYNAILATICYAVLPYHALTIYVRGAFAEVMVWTLLPWVIYHWTKPITSRRQIAYSSLITSLFFLSHNTVVWFVLPIISLSIIFIQKKIARTYSILALFLSLFLSSFYLIPVVFEQSYVQAEQIAKQTKLSDHFLSLSQLWHSAWGYGGSAPLDQIDGMSFMLGKFPLVIAVFAIFKTLLSRSLDRYKTAFVVITFLFAYATTFNSQWLWRFFPLAEIVQFPWRLLLYASFGIAYMTAWLLPPKLPNLRGSAMTLFLSILLIYFSAPFFQPQGIKNYDDTTFLSQPFLSTVSKDKIPEYLPAWMPEFPEREPSDGLSRQSTRVTGLIENKTEQSLVIETAYMPHWRLTLNGYPTDIIPNPDGTIRTHAVIPPGTYNIDLTWHKTPVEKFGAVLSLLALIIVLGLAL